MWVRIGSYANLRRYVDHTFPHVWYTAKITWYGVLFRDGFGETFFTARKLPFDKYYMVKHRRKNVCV